jgi:hypothetical protein
MAMPTSSIATIRSATIGLIPIDAELPHSSRRRIPPQRAERAHRFERRMRHFECGLRPEPRDEKD